MKKHKEKSKTRNSNNANAVLNEVGGAVRKVIIEDLVSHHNGTGEKELPSDQAIRFEDANFKYTVGWDKATGRLAIYKIAKGFDDSIKIRPQSCNRITIE